MLATLLVGAGLLGFALSVDFPRAAHGFKGDEATYYSLTHSLARDFDFSFTRVDLVRVWDEFPTGPEGIFLKRGRRVTLRRADAFPWVRIGKPTSSDRLFYGKSFIYPLVAAPFVRVFGTNGFLVLHALLLTLCFGAAVAWLGARGSPPPLAVAYAAVFLGVSIVPVYFVWLTPELFNFSLVLLAYFLWSYKESAASGAATGPARLFYGSASDYMAAALLGVATFSKPVHIVLIGPLVALALWRRQWKRSAVMLVVFVAATASLFFANYMTTGDVNYQGGNRKTFYGYTGFPFANPRETFETTGQDRATNAVPLDIVVTKDAPKVFGYNLAYFTIGRYSGFVPYFFPGVVSLALFLGAPRRRPLWQWLIAGVAVVAAIGLILYMPYTLLRWRRTSRQPLLSELLRSVSVHDSRAHVADRAIDRDGDRRAVHGAARVESVRHVVRSRRPRRSRARCGSPDRAHATDRSPGQRQGRSITHQARRRSADAGLFPGRQRLPDRGRMVLGAWTLARRHHPAGAGGGR